MSSADHIPTVEQLRILHTALNQLVRLSSLPPDAQDWSDKVDLMTAVDDLENITTLPPYYTSGMGLSRVQNWPAGMNNALGQIRRTATAVRERWGLTKYTDLPPYDEEHPEGGRAGNPIPDSPLVFVGVEIEILRWANGILVEALDWSARQEPTDDSQQPTPGTDESDDYPPGDQELLTPTQAISRANDIGIRVTYQSILLAKDSGKIVTFAGDRQASYYIECSSFDVWVIDWWRGRQGKG
jgi:hypothetical protein